MREPAEGAFHYPTARQHFKHFHLVVSFDDFKFDPIFPNALLTPTVIMMRHSMPHEAICGVLVGAVSISRSVSGSIPWFVVPGKLYPIFKVT